MENLFVCSFFILILLGLGFPDVFVINDHQYFWYIFIGNIIIFSWLISRQEAKRKRENAAEWKRKNEENAAEWKEITKIAHEIWESEIQPAVKPVLLKELEMSMDSAWDYAKSEWENNSRNGRRYAQKAWRGFYVALSKSADSWNAYKRIVREELDKKCKVEDTLFLWRSKIENELDERFRTWKHNTILEYAKQVSITEKIKEWNKERWKKRKNVLTKQEYNRTRKRRTQEPKAVVKNKNDTEDKQEIKRESERGKPKVVESIRNANAKAVTHDVMWDANRAKQAAIKKVDKEAIEKDSGCSKQEAETAIKKKKAKEEQREEAQKWIDKWINKEEHTRKSNSKNTAKENKIEFQKRVDNEVGDDVDAAVVLEGVHYTNPGCDKVEIIHSDELLKRASEKAVFVEGKEFIYVIQNSFTKSVKIGYSNNPYRRLAELQTSNENLLILKGCTRGNVADERLIQEYFMKYNIFNEWFEFSKPIKEYVSQANLFIPTLKTREEAQYNASRFDIRVCSH